MKLIALGSALLFTSFISYPNLPLSQANSMNICPMHEAKSGDICPMHDMKNGDICPMHASPQAQVAMVHHDHQAMMAEGAVAMEQDQKQEPDPNPPQPGDTPTHRLSPGDGCSSVDPNAKPGTELNGVKKNTVGCGCVKKCVNGQTQEDRSKDKNERYICKNACHPDRCFCPDPCKS